MSLETQPLLPQPSTDAQSLQEKVKKVCCWPKHICLPSKAAILIILWTAVVGTVYIFITGATAASIMTSKYAHTFDVGVIGSIPQVVLAVIMTFYPLSGFIADVCCGRFKIVIISINLILVSIVMICVMALILTGEHIDNHISVSYLLHKEGILILLLSLVAVIFFIVGLTGYQANIIQFGLDQLLEAPCEYLGLFSHWATWALNFSSIIFFIVVSLISCHSLRHMVTTILQSTLPLVLAITLLLSFIISCWKRHWFYSEPGQHNPYIIAFKVLNYARKHKHPLQRSAFTYGDNHIPSRIDFAKERYGGPFDTEQVENVKTLLRILLLLFALGPAYVLQVPASLYIFPLFGLHTGYNYSLVLGKDHCSAYRIWIVFVGIGGLTALSATILLPVYTWYIFSALRKKLPKMLTRLKIGIGLCLLGVISMLITDVVGHSVNTYESGNKTESQCMFTVTKVNYTLEYQPLNMHWSVLIPPSVFLGIGPLLITATTLEFISAQSPHSMKGLLVGVSFAIQGFFQLIGYLVILPLSLTQPWIQAGTPVVNCEFAYFLFTSVVGLVGLTLFSIAAKKYKYRKRDDENFSQKEVEEVYIRYLTQAARAT